MSTNSGANYPAAALAPPLEWDGDVSAHSVQFYAEDAFLLDELSRFIGAALGAGDAGLVIATPEHRDGLAQRLEARGVDLDRAATQGRYIAWDAAETLSRTMQDGRPDVARFANLLGGALARVTAAGSRAAVFGEMVALLWAEGKPQDAIQLEHLWNDLARTHAFSLRCAYPISSFGRTPDGEHLGTICAMHSHVIPAETYTALGTDAERLRAITLWQHKAQALETEIEERKQVQAALQRRDAELADFLENAVEGVQQVGADQVVVWANQALLGLLGYTAPEYVGHPLGAFHVRQDGFEEFWRKLMRREDICDYPAELRCKDGSVKHVLIHSNGLWDGDRFVHTRCFIRDVTEQKRMEQALRDSNRELRAAVAARDEFLSVAAHELKTPVTSLRGFAQLLLRDARRKREIAPERLASALDAIDLQTGKLDQLVARLLDSAQIEAGKLRIEPVRTDLAALVQTTLARYRGSSSHTFVFEGPPQLEAMVDPVRFEQVLTNLLDNAVKFSPLGGSVTVELGYGDDGGIRLSVTDQGVGIPPAQREEVFEQFHQAHGARHLSGLGLGLYITREIVELHGGHVRIEEPAYRGSRFVVTLPPSARPQGQPHRA